jgi:hypothetical protein
MPYSDDAWLDDTQIENRPLAPGQSQNALRLTVSEATLRVPHIPHAFPETCSAAATICARSRWRW